MFQRVLAGARTGSAAGGRRVNAGSMKATVRRCASDSGRSSAMNGEAGAKNTSSIRWAMGFAASSGGSGLVTAWAVPPQLSAARTA